MNVRAVPVVRIVSAVATIASMVALVWVWQWSKTNTDAADYEHQRFLISAFIVASTIGVGLVTVQITAPARIGGRVVTSAGVGSFVAV